MKDSKNTKRLTILSEVEKFALYGLPDFNDQQRREYFSFSEEEMVIIKSSAHVHINIYSALQIGYFKAKKIFFYIQWNDIVPEDFQFIIQHYFVGSAIQLTDINISKYEFYKQRKEIAELFCYQFESHRNLLTLYKEASQIIKRDTSPNFIARELIKFLNDIKLIRPGYTTLQDIISKSLTDERKRISIILDNELTNDHKLSLDQLMVNEDSISKLAGFKEDAKNFSFKMMAKEREKHNSLEPFYIIARNIIPKLSISKQNIDNYTNLANHYNIYDLRALKYNQNYLYILCYVLHRYRQLNDNLIEAFVYNVKKLEKTIQAKVKTNFADDSKEPQEKIAKLLLLYVDDEVHDACPFLDVRKSAFAIMSKEDIQIVGHKMLKGPKQKKEFKWQEIDKAHRLYKKRLRPLLMRIDFSSEVPNNPWLISTQWLQKIFANNQKLSDRPFNECPNDTIPKHLQPYLLENNRKTNKTINSNRYEYWIYCQINKQISSGGLYVEDSINHRCFNHELVIIKQKEELLKTLNIKWFQKPLTQHIDELVKESNYLWSLFDKHLKQDKLTHLKYDKKKAKLCYTKIKANKNEILQNKFFKQVSFRDISDILSFVNESCDFFSALVPLQPRYAKLDNTSLDNINKLAATIMSQAFNHGNYKMSQISDISYRSLETTHQQCLRLSTLKEASNIISNSLSKLGIFPYYSLDFELIYSSVDGQKFELDTPNIKGRYSRKHLREGQGVSAYTCLVNHIPLQCELIGSHEHESYFVFDIWHNNSSEIIPEVITGDMHVINKANFAILSWFGVELNPRFTDLNDQLKNLYSIDDTKKYENYIIKPVGQIDINLIIEQKSNIDQLVATLGVKEINQANLIKKLCHLPPENSLRKAVFEYDKLVRTIYTLKYMMNVDLQKKVHKSQNRIESYHQLRAAISKVGGKKQLYGKTDIDIEISNQCGRLIALAIIYYNSIILSGVLAKYENLENNKRFLEMLKKISPVAWHSHIHFLGQYTFQNKNINIINIEKILDNIYLN